MARTTLKAAYYPDGEERYIAGASPSFVRILEDKLPFWSFNEAMAFYAEVFEHLTKNEVALLGCNDRFFLLTGLLNRKDAIHPWIYDRAREVEAEPDGYLDLWARYHYKSSVITFAGTIQEVLIDPEIRVAIFSNTKAIARPFVQQIKEEWEGNEPLKEIYSDVLWQNPRVEAPTWSLDGGLTVKRKGNPRECTIEGHGLIDALPTGKHFPLLVYDDVITEKNVTNKDQVKKASERVELSFPCGIGELTRKRFIGTRYSYSDSYGHLLDRKIATPRLYPATDDGTIDGEPVFMTATAWETVKREQRSNISAQMLQNPIAGTENTFYTKWLTPYYVRPAMMNVYIMGDPSAGRSATSDRTAIAVVGIDTAGNKYLLDGYCHRMKLGERWDKLSGLHKKWKNMPGVQTLRVGWERYGMQSDDQYFEERQRLTGHHFEITELNWTGDATGHSKGKRVGRLEPDFRNSRFYLPYKIHHPEMIHPETRVLVPAKWRVLSSENEEDKALMLGGAGDEFYFQPLLQPHREEQRARAQGETWRVVDALRRLDEDGNIYDLTRLFFEEYRFFPFAPHDDLIDAVSRIYDMEPSRAIRHEHFEVPDYPDA